MDLKSNVLIVDDQEGIREFLAEVCGIMGFQAIEAASGEAALKILEENDFQAAFIDLSMPGLDGYTILQRAIHKNPQLAAFLMSGYDRDEIKEQAVRIGAKGVLAKPFDLSEIMTLLETL